MTFGDISIGTEFKIANKNYVVFPNARLKKISKDTYMVMSGEHKGTYRSFWDWVEVKTLMTKH